MIAIHIFFCKEILIVKQSYLNSKKYLYKMNWKKKKEIQKEMVMGAFVLYVQIQIGRIFTRSRA